MWHYSIDGGLCSANDLLKTHLELGKQLRENSKTDTYIKATRTDVDGNLFVTTEFYKPMCEHRH